MAKKKKKNSGSVNGILAALIIALVVLSGVLVWMCLNVINTTPAPRPQVQKPTEAAVETETTEATEPPTTVPPEPEHVVSTATIGATGDILMHLPVINTGKQSDGSYNFDSIFQYLKEYSESVDYAIANLETTLAGLNNGYAYKGYPQFNCPDEIVDGLKNAGFDMLLTANNHCYDTTMVGYTRTIEVIRDRGLLHLGTRATPEDNKYEIIDINGIKVGMLCYTYETPIPENGYAGRVYLNGLAMAKGGEELINSFLPSRLDPFYAEVQGYLDEMQAAGAEATVMFIHWGEEYVFTPIPYQKAVAQKLCDMGIDVIVGGHPHVVEPIELITSTIDENQKTVCLYSMGNAVSNQRMGNISRVTTAHTEDGVWFTMTFSKYSDDTVYLDSVDLMPLWVDMRSNGARTYNIIPLDYGRLEEWQGAFELSNVGYTAAQNSYDRTMKLVSEGLTASNEYLTAERIQREVAYQEAVNALLRAA